MNTSLKKPAPLRPGDVIGIISPASVTWELELFEQGAARLEAMGFRVRVFPQAKNKQLYLAGTDAERLADLHAAFEDPEVKGILCARGGYGCMRLLPDIDWNRIAAHPKVLIGFSDVTALLLPLYQRTGMVGFYGPMLTSNLVHSEPYSQTELFRLVSEPLETPWTIPNRDPYHSFRPGVAEGPLIGGNLSLLAALCGTPDQPRTAGHILFIEDWKEKYYALDRQFEQLKQTGLFNGIRGLLLCDFSECNFSEIETEPEPPLPDFLRELTDFVGVPTGYGFSVGHGEQTATLPIGCSARFDAGSGTLTLLESPVL